MYIKSQKVNSNAKRIWGEFKLSDGTISKFEMKKGDSWEQWNNTMENLCFTQPYVEKICEQWTEEY